MKLARQPAWEVFQSTSLELRFLEEQQRHVHALIPTPHPPHVTLLVSFQEQLLQRVWAQYSGLIPLLALPIS